jgi:hypothetical protein
VPSIGKAAKEQTMKTRLLPFVALLVQNQATFSAMVRCDS